MEMVVEVQKNQNRPPHYYSEIKNSQNSRTFAPHLTELWSIS
jgi:hypothetical protein